MGFGFQQPVLNVMGQQCRPITPPRSTPLGVENGFEDFSYDVNPHGGSPFCLTASP